MAIKKKKSVATFLNARQFKRILENHKRERVRARKPSLVAAADATTVASSTRARRGFAPADTGAPPDVGFDPLIPGSTIRLTTVPRDQMSSDRCIAFAVAAAMETAICRARNTNAGVPEISVEHILSKCKGQTGSVLRAQTAVGEGVLDSTCFPDATKVPCAKPAEHTWKCDLRAVKGQKKKRVSLMKQQLRDVGPLISLIQVYSDFLKYNSTAPYVGKLPSAGFHAVCIVGFESDPGGGGRWIARNSMGPAWNGTGFLTIPFDDPQVKSEDAVFVAADVRQ